MMTTGERITSGLTRVWSWLRDSFAGLPTVVWAVSYWPILAGILVALPFVFMPVWLDLSTWTYLVTVPIGIAAGFIGYGAAYMMMEE